MNQVSADQILIVDFVQNASVRLISTAYLDEPALAPLADDEAALTLLADIEMRTAARHNSLVALPAGINPDELLSPVHGFGWSYVNAAFCYTRAGGNRFNSVARGAWYAAYGENAIPTAQAEIAFHLTAELDNVGVYDNITNYRELLAGFVTRFHDLHGFQTSPFLDADPLIAYPAGQILATDLAAKGSNGVLYPSTRFAGGLCLAAFRPHITQNIRYGKTWQFTWDGDREPTISETSGFAPRG